MARPSSGLAVEAEEAEVPPKDRGLDVTELVALDFSDAVLGNTDLNGRLLEREAATLSCGDALLRQEPETKAVADGDATRTGEFDEGRPEQLANASLDERDLAPGKRTPPMFLVDQFSSLLPAA
jgi:hypothetical protein